MMTSSPLDSTQVQQRRAWDDITALGLHTWSNNVGRGMQSSPLGSTDSRTTSGVACHHRPWTANMVERRWAWHAIIAFGQHRQSNGVGRGMPSSPLGSTDGRTASGNACHQRPWTAQTIGRRRAWHAIIALGQHTRSDDVGRGMPLSPLDSIDGSRRRAWHSIIALGQHTWSDDIGRGIPSSPLD